MTDPRTGAARIGDREREAATSILNDHYAAGRLLPRAVAPPTRIVAPVRRTPSWRAPLTMFLIAALVLAIAFQVPWWLWLIGLVVLLKSRHWGGRSSRHACHNHGPRTRP